MVVPEREAPGYAAAMSWPAATPRAIAQVTRSVVRRPYSQRSRPTNSSPPVSVAQATGVSVLGSLNPAFFRASPPMAVTTKAAASLRR